MERGGGSSEPRRLGNQCTGDGRGWQAVIMPPTATFLSYGADEPPAHKTSFRNE